VRSGRPLIPSTLPEESVSSFGKQLPMKRPDQPAELATAFVMLADPLFSYVSGAMIAVTVVLKQPAAANAEDGPITADACSP
jgi:NAD(P)-dependent dehydrogenase (short-subunit alcohol dehydrogenase family)